MPLPHVQAYDTSEVTLTSEQVYTCLRQVIDPELHVDVVSLGLIYDVTVSTIQTDIGPQPFAHIVYTLTTPGCPLAGVFDKMIRDQCTQIAGIDPYKHISLELTFDPPWIPDMMAEETRLELGLA